MALNRYNLKKWIKMIFGKSELHVKQDVGKNYSLTSIKGYYNDLTLKVLNTKIQENELPRFEYQTNKYVDFSIQIFQYGLGAYDLYLQTNDKKFLNRFYKAVDWAANNINENGSIDTFSFLNDKFPYSSMAQGEAISLLLRAYVNSNNTKYLVLAKKALKFMLTDIKDGGTAIFENEKIYLKEYCDKPIVLNGFVFSLFGFYDYVIIDDSKELKVLFQKCLDGLINILPQCDLKYWSKYDTDKKVASPFYHKLHISLLSVVYEISNNEVVNNYKNKFIKYQKNPFNRFRAFTKKVFQKVGE